MNNRKKFLCLDCEVDTGKIGEHYMLKDSTWNKVHNSNVGMLCIGCFEIKLGRKLIPSDFNDSHVNRIASGYTKSNRLCQRLGLL